MYHSQQHRMQNCQFLYLRKSFGYNRELFVCPSCVHRVAIGRLRVCVGSILAFYQIREENRAKLKISYSCGHRVSKSARYDATLLNHPHGRIQRGGGGGGGGRGSRPCPEHFCHVEIFCQTPSGSLDPPPPEKIFWIRA